MCRFTFCFTFATLVILNLNIDQSSACNGYKMRLISIEKCNDDNVISLDKGFNVTLTDDCMLTTSGCVNSKGFKEGKVKFTVSKNGNEMLSGHPDICNALDHKNKEQKEKLEMFGFPTECPIPEGQKCMDGSKKVDFSKFKNLLPMAAGKITAHFEATHDTGKTCADVKFEISK